MTGAYGVIGFWIWPSSVAVGLVLLGYLVYRLIENRGPGNAGVAAREILDLRLARGEIDEDEYPVNPSRRDQLR